MQGLPFRIWKLRWNQWMRSACVLSDAQMVTETLKVIRDSHPERPGIQTLFWQSLPQERQDNPTIKDLRTFLEDQFTVDESQEIYEDFVEFIMMKIKPGEPYHDYIIRWTNSRLRVEARIPGIKIPDIILVMLLRRGAQLDDATMRSIRAAVKWYNEEGAPNTDVLKQTVQAIKEVCTGQRAKAPATASVKLVTAGGQTEIQYDGRQIWCDGDAMVTAAQMEVNIANAALPPRRRKTKPGQEGKDGRADGKKKQEVPKPNLMHIRCFSCQELGHYKTQCPKHSLTAPHNHRNTDGACITQETVTVTKEEMEKLEEDIRKGECLNVQESLAFTEEEMKAIREAREAEEEVFDQKLEDVEIESEDEEEEVDREDEIHNDAMEDEVFEEDPELKGPKPVAASSEKKVCPKEGEKNPEQTREHPELRKPDDHKGARILEMDKGVRHLSDGHRIPEKWAPWTPAFPFVERRYDSDPPWVQDGGVWNDPKGQYEGMARINERNRWITRGRVDREGNTLPGQDPRREFTQDWIQDVNFVKRETPEYKKPESDEEMKRMEAKVRERLDPWGDGRKVQVSHKKPETREEMEEAEAMRKLNPWGDSQKAEIMLIETGVQNGNFAVEAKYSAALDTCCTKTVVGFQWWINYRAELSDDYRKLMPDLIPNQTTFRYPSGQEEATATGLIPVQIHGKFFRLRAEVVAANIPLILGRPTLVEIELALDFKKRWTTVFGVARQMLQSTAGHPMVRVFPEVPLEKLKLNSVGSIGDENDEIFQGINLNPTREGGHHNDNDDQGGDNDGDNPGGEQADDGRNDVEDIVEETGGYQEVSLERLSIEDNDEGGEEAENADEEDNGNERRPRKRAAPGPPLEQPDEKETEVHRFSALNEPNKKRVRFSDVDYSSTRPPVRKEAQRLRDAVKQEPGSSDEMDDGDSVFSLDSSQPARSGRRASTPATNRRRRGSGQQPLEVDNTLPLGWRRQVKRRKRGKSAGRWDVHIWAPRSYARGKGRGTGRRFRSAAELRDHFKKVGERRFHWEDFDFSVSGRGNQAETEALDDSEEEESDRAEEAAPDEVEEAAPDESEEEEIELPEENLDDIEDGGRVDPEMADPLATEEPEGELDQIGEDEESDAERAQDGVQDGEETKTGSEETDATENGCPQNIKDSYVRMIRVSPALIRMAQGNPSSGEDSQPEDEEFDRDSGDWSELEDEEDNPIAGDGRSYDAPLTAESRSRTVRTPAQTQVSPSVDCDSNANSKHLEESGAETAAKKEKEDDAGMTFIGTEEINNEEAVTSVEEEENTSPDIATEKFRKMLAETQKRIKQGRGPAI